MGRWSWQIEMSSYFDKKNFDRVFIWSKFLKTWYSYPFIVDFDICLREYAFFSEFCVV